VNGLRLRRSAAVTALGLLLVVLGTGSATAATGGRIVRAEFRDCQVIRVVYTGYPPETIITWAVNQFGREIDRGAFVSGTGGTDSVQIVSLRLRAPADPGTDAEFVLDGSSSVRRKPQCESTGPTVAPTTTVPPAPPTAPPTVAPRDTGTDPAVIDPGEPIPNGGGIADAGRDLATEDSGPGLGTGLTAAILIVVLACGLAVLALTRRPGAKPRRAPERPLPPWLHVPVPKKRSWFRRK